MEDAGSVFFKHKRMCTKFVTSSYLLVHNRKTILDGFSKKERLYWVILGKYDILHTVVSMQWMCIIVLYNRTPYDDQGNSVHAPKKV